MFFANYFITIFIDYDVNSIIVNQIKLSISFVNKFNFELIKISIYLLQFRIKNFHSNEKSNIIFDVFFCLLIVCNKLKNHTIDNFNVDVTNKLIDTLMQIIDDFRKKIINDYNENST